MRERKYRAYNKKTGQMIDLQAITPLALDSTMMQDGVFIPFHEDIIVMDWTGLKDRADVEIYEGDVIAIKCRGKWTAKKVIEWNNYLGFDMPANVGSAGSPWKVIGNIYENSELMGSKP